MPCAATYFGGIVAIQALSMLPKSVQNRLKPSCLPTLRNVRDGGIQKRTNSSKIPLSVPPSKLSKNMVSSVCIVTLKLKNSLWQTIDETEFSEISIDPQSWNADESQKSSFQIQPLSSNCDAHNHVTAENRMRITNLLIDATEHGNRAQ